MNKKRINAARDRRIAKTQSTKLGIVVVSTNEGIQVDLGGTTLDMGVDKSIEVAATIMVAILPAAMRNGDKLDSVGDKFWMLLTEKCQMVHDQLDNLPS
jgi:hypothetical protein